MALRAGKSYWYPWARNSACSPDPLAAIAYVTARDVAVPDAEHRRLKLHDPRHPRPARGSMPPETGAPHGPMHLTLDALVVLDAIARGGSFARAAERLHRVPSAVSYSVHKLEQDLGVTIFDRTGHRARLTEAGLQLLQEGRELLERAEGIERRVRRVHAGMERKLRIVLGDMVVTSGIYPILTKFHATPEHRPIELCMEVGSQGVCWERLASGNCDVAIGAPAAGADHDAYDVRPLGAVSLTLAMSYSHPLSRAAEPVPDHALAPHRIVRQACAGFGAAELHGAEYVTVADSSSQVDAIRHGVGVGYVPWYLVQDDVASGRLVTKAVAQPPELQVVVASRRREHAAGSALGWLLHELGDEAVRSRFVPRAGAPQRA